MPAKRNVPRWKVLVSRSVLALIGGALLWFAVEGGEYGTSALLAQRTYHETLTAEVKALEQEVDSLQKEVKLVRTSDVVLERIAREQYGMLKGGKEILFWTGDSRSDGEAAAGRDTLSGR